MKKIIILFSGNGTNLEAIANAIEVQNNIKIVCAVTNKADAYGIKRAQKFGINVEILKHKEFTSQIINIHPSLLPLFKGANAIEIKLQVNLIVERF